MTDEPKPLKVERSKEWWLARVDRERDTDDPTTDTRRYASDPEMSVADTLRMIATTARLFPIGAGRYQVALTDMDLEALRLAADQLEPVDRIRRDIEADVDRIAREQWGGARE
jgi:hypothetical protein